ncbi:hypothetical protein QNH20_24925 [Neobacillus sp. WH10]|uniref:hypothetical protein n=1 Tax=Neobacillus sp. WH10 TaxID=3047873 RepID=UPI0024C0E9D7|nr:hypothetical protein [Neobacillus sp. WH10]WHY77278.1 hypothetical protein QNH20_24925 [Neobacillus sp. WH10]
MKREKIMTEIGVTVVQLSEPKQQFNKKQPEDSLDITCNRRVNACCTIIIPEGFRVIEDFAFAELAFNPEGVKCIIEPVLIPATSNDPVCGKTFSGSISVNQVRLVGSIPFLADVFPVQGSGRLQNLASACCTGSISVDQFICVTTFTDPCPNIVQTLGAATIREIVQGPCGETFVTLDIVIEFPECVIPESITLNIEQPVCLDQPAFVFGEVLDENGNALPNILVDLTIQPLSGCILPRVETDFVGRFFTTFTPDSISTTTITATVSRTDISTSITFDPIICPEATAD